MLLDRIKSFFNAEEASDSLYQELRNKSAASVDEDPQLALKYLRIAASLAWLSNSSHKHDKKMDAIIHGIGSSHVVSEKNNEEEGSLVIITSGILEFGGLTQQVENLVKFLPDNQKLKVWSTESFSNSNLDCDRGHSIRKKAEILTIDKNLDHITSANKIAEWTRENPVSGFIYFLSPDDTTGFLLPSMLPNFKHILINVSHHVFCLGSFQFDGIVDVSDFYYNESIAEERNEQIHKIYLSGRGQLADLQLIPKNNIREELGIPSEAYLTVTVGNPSKSIWDSDQSYIYIIGQMLQSFGNVHHLLIAKGMDRIKKLIAYHYPKVKDKIHVLEGTRDLIPTLKACDLYLNSYPMGGALSSLDAIASSLAIVAIPAQKDWFKISEITALNQEEYLGIIRMFIDDFEFRLEHAATLQEFYKNNHQPKKVAEQYLELVKKIELGKKEYKEQESFKLHGLKGHVDLGKLEREVIRPYLALGNKEDVIIQKLRKQLD